MLPNVAFVALILLSIYFLLKDQNLKLLSMVIAALFTGLAVSIRPIEIVWLAAIYLAVFIYLKDKDKHKFRKLFLFLVIVVLVVWPSIYQQKVLYGDFLTTGYNQLQIEQVNDCTSCVIIKSLTFPFGFHPTLVVTNLWTHFLSSLWWLSLLTIMGLVAFLFQSSKQKPEIFGYIILSLFIFGYLGVYYGSWQFADLLTVHLNTLGISYIRYWIPLFILAIPFTAIGIIFLLNFFKGKLKNLVLLLILIFLAYQSANLVLQSKPDSLLPVRNRIADYKQNASAVITQTEPESVIITVRKDKLFFPDRKVIHSFASLKDSQEILDILPNLISEVPVYYYALSTEESLDLNNGLSLKFISNIGNEVLYKIQ